MTPGRVVRRLAVAAALAGAASAGVGTRAAAQQPPGRDVPLSLDALEARARADSNDPVAHFALAVAYRDRRRLDDAERAFRAAAALAPQYADAYLGLAELVDMRDHHYWNRRRKAAGEEAIEEAWREHDRLFRRAFYIDPLVDPSLLSRAEERPTLTIGGRSYRIWWAFPFAKGINALRAGKFEEALRRFEEILERGEAYAPDVARWYHGIAAAHLRRYDVAVQDFWTLVQESAKLEQSEVPSPVPLRTNDYRYMLATMLYLNGQHGEAIPVFRRVLEFDVGFYMADVQLARMYEAAERWDEAVEARRGAINANPDDASLVLDLGGTLLRAGRVEEALAEIRSAAEAAPRDPRAPYLLGWAAHRLGRTSEARAAWERFLAIASSRYAAQVEEVRRELALGQ